MDPNASIEIVPMVSSGIIKINGINYLEQIKKEAHPVIFYSGHFANFELMAPNILRKLKKIMKLQFFTQLT